MLKEKSEFLKNAEDSPFWVDELAGNLRYFEFDYVRCNYYLIYNETERKYNITPWEDETYTFLSSALMRRAELFAFSKKKAHWVDEN